MKTAAIRQGDALGNAAKRNPVVVVTTVYLLFHLILCITFDASAPDAFLRGDRAVTRMQAVENMLSVRTWPEFWTVLYSSGLPGDYLWQAAILKLCDSLPQPRLGLIAFQIALTSISILCLGWICRILTLNKSVAVGATLLYAAIPHTSVFPHLLVSEAFFVPFGIFASYYAIQHIENKDGHFLEIKAALFWALCALTRPTAQLFPFVMFAMYMIWNRQKWRRHILFVTFYLVLICLWAVPSFIVSGQTNLAGGDRGMFNRTLHRKADYLIAVLPQEDQQHEYARLHAIEPDSFTSGELIALYLRYPAPAAMVTAIETAKLILKFDETKILNYAGIWSAGRGSDWGKEFVQDPRSVLSKNPLVAFMVVGGIILWTGALLLAAWGILATAPKKTFAPCLLLAYLAYSLAVVHAVDFIQGRHRYPVDFIICIFASIGAFHLRQSRWLSAGRGRTFESSGSDNK